MKKMRIGRINMDAYSLIVGFCVGYMSCFIAYCVAQVHQMSKVSKFVEAVNIWSDKQEN